MNSPAMSYIFNALRQPKLDCGSVPYTPLGAKAPRHVSENAPLVSIITVTFNAADMIEQAIRSVAEQRYDNIEYLIIDGGSTDETMSIVRRNAPHVDCLISEPDKGIYDAMNKGLLRARGQYIALLNSDDRLFPDFVVQSLAVLQETDADISYCDYTTEDGSVSVGEINNGVFLSQLGIKHNTFLMHRECFARVGGFDARLKVVADAKWNRAAFASGLRFVKVPGQHVYYSLRGLSAGANQALRDQIIDESAYLILDSFPQLDRDQARILYLSNFNTHNADQIIALHRNMAATAPVLADMIEQATRWNIAHRVGYFLKPEDGNRLRQVLSLANYFGVQLTDLVFENPRNDASQAISALFATLEELRQSAAVNGESICLHFARVFSSPSETFIYDFLMDLTAAEDGFVHTILCDTRKETITRPFARVLHVPWDELKHDIRNTLYSLIWSMLSPKRVVAHFALNGWILHDRLTSEQRLVEWVNMCHGIDVFAYGENPNYSAYIDQYCAEAPNVAFTAVSQFLARLLHSHGVPEEKIFSVPNAVSNRFWDNRKNDGFWDGARPLRLLSVGRLIRWKGHEVLLRALADVQLRRPDIRIDLDIVYGRWDEQLETLIALRDSLGLVGEVRFIDYVDFHSAPSFMAQYDLFVLPSTTSDDPVPRTETFGVAVIEAISAGLPVIGTDAGGIPEVLGPSHPQAITVPHGHTEALTQAILCMLNSPDVTFADNADYAAGRTALFSAEARLDNWSLLASWFGRPRKRIVHFCALGSGGAANASVNIHKGFLRKGFDSWFVTRDSEAEKLNPYMANTILVRPENSVDYNHTEAARRPEFTTFTLDDHIISNATLHALVKDADVINLTWPAKFLSVQNIAMLTRLGVPVLMTIRDMNQITGGCHFFHGCTQWTEGCQHCPQLPDTAPQNYPAMVFEAKQAAWNFDNITFVALSNHSMNILDRSALTAGAKKVKLPNYVDTDLFFRDHATLPDIQALPETVLKIGYLPSFGSRVKGHREFLATLRFLQAKRPDLRAVILLASNDTLPPQEAPYEVIKLGAISDREKLRRFYNSTDIVAVPSLEETFSNTTLEALACGVPVVGFKTGILQEILADGRCGGCVDIGDCEALAETILRLADAPPDPDEIIATVRHTYSRETVMASYLEVVEHLPQVTSSDIDPDYIALEDAATLLRLSNIQQNTKSRAILRRLVHMRDRLRLVEDNHKKKGKQVAFEERDEMYRQVTSVTAARDQAFSQVAELEEEVRALRHSTSWRITAPVRILGRGLRGLIRWR